MINNIKQTALQILAHDYQVAMHLKSSQAKLARRKPARNASHLRDQAAGLFINKPGQIFLNPTDSQLDKIYNGELWGYKS